ncbi:MAG: DUF2975 domain-containing protein [Oscillospiraceae bacterium]|jgi:hypothetical protein|nr:DUF2975 domain-containing protein [Oscillospiraceae bacterium]
MAQTSVQKLAQVLRVLVIITLVCNILALFLVPMMAFTSSAGEVVHWGMDELSYLFGLEPVPDIYYCFDLVLLLSWAAVWRDAYLAVLTVFLWACGTCTAVILWQAKRVLDTILKGTPFVMDNAKSMRRAAICCFLISGAAFLRLIWGFVTYKSILPLLTYNALFVPIFLMGGLLFLVMSALFRQAAELKAENDLTI